MGRMESYHQPEQVLTSSPDSSNYTQTTLKGLHNFSLYNHEEDSFERLFCSPYTLPATVRTVAALGSAPVPPRPGLHQVSLPSPNRNFDCATFSESVRSLESERCSIQRARKKREEGAQGRQKIPLWVAGFGVWYVWQTALLLMLSQDQQGTCQEDSKCRNCNVYKDK